MRKYKVRPATYEDVRHFYPDMPHTMKAIVLDGDGELYGIAGVTIEHNRMIALSVFKDNAPAKAIYKGIVVFRKLLESFNSPIVAIRDSTYCNSDKFLEKVGFHYIRTIPEGDIYLWKHYSQ